MNTPLLSVGDSKTQLGALPANPTKTGYSFNDWWTETSGAGTPLTSATNLPLSNAEYYADWTINKYTVTINSNNTNYGTVSPTSVTSVNHGTTYSASGNVLTIGSTSVTATAKTGYQFSSWSSTSGTITENTTLTATFTARTDTAYKVEHYVMDVDGAYPSTATSSENKSGATGASITLSTQKDSSKEVANGIVYKEGKVDNAVVTTTTILADGSRVIKLYYERKAYRLTLNIGVGISAVTGGEIYYYYGKSISINATVTTGFTWSNWTGESTITDQLTSVIMKTYAMSYTANATRNTSTLIIDANGGNITNGSYREGTHNLNYDTAIGIYAPTRTGYTFAGWTLTKTGNGTANGSITNNTPIATATQTYTFGPTDGASDTLTAQWEEAYFSVTRSGITNYYATLKEAVDSITNTGTTITVLKNYYMTESVTISMSNTTITSIQSVTLFRTNSIGTDSLITIGGVSGTTISGNLTFDGQKSNSGVISATNGGAISTNLASLTIKDNVQFKNFKVTNSGGAIYNGGDSATLIIKNNVLFSGNEASQGGAIYNNIYNTAQISDSVQFKDNNAVLYGGAIYNYSSGQFKGKIELYGTIKFDNNKSGTGGSIKDDDIYLSGDSILTITGAFTPKNSAGQIRPLKLQILSLSNGRPIATATNPSWLHEANQFDTTSLGYGVYKDGSNLKIGIISTVGFNSNGGSAPIPSSKEVTYGSTYGDLPTVTKSGFTFSGWFTASVGGNQVTSNTTVTNTNNHTLYAQWITTPPFFLNITIHDDSAMIGTAWLEIIGGIAIQLNTVVPDRIYYALLEISMDDWQTMEIGLIPYGHPGGSHMYESTQFYWGHRDPSTATVGNISIASIFNGGAFPSSPAGDGYYEVELFPIF